MKIINKHYALKNDFHQLGLVVTKSVCVSCVLTLSPFHAIFFEALIGPVIT